MNLRHVRQLYQKYPDEKKFYISWANELSHDDTNMIQVDIQLIQGIHLEDFPKTLNTD